MKPPAASSMPVIFPLPRASFISPPPSPFSISRHAALSSTPPMRQEPLVEARMPRIHYAVTLNGEPLEVDSPVSGHHHQRNIALAIAAALELRNLNGYNLAINGTTRNYGGSKIR